MAANESTYVLDVKLNDDNEIFTFSYNTKWNDISLMLLLKYDCEGYWFSFINKDDILKIINNQDDFNEALQFCANNVDVLNVQMWSPDMPKEDLNKKKEEQPDTPVDGENTENGESRSSQYLMVAGKAIGGIGHLASGVVKSATNYFSPSAPSTPEDTNEDPKADIELEEMSPSTSAKPNIPERPTVDTPPSQVEADTIKPQQDEESSSDGKTQPKREENYAVEVADSIKDETSAPTTTESELVERIKQEVQSAVRMELQAIREELTQLVVTKQQVGFAAQTRSIIVMKEDIKLLKKDLKLAQNMQGLIDSRLLSGSDRRSNLDRDMTVAIVCENLPAQSRVDPGKEFEKCWVLKNDGDRPWCPGITLKMVDEEPDSRFDGKKGRDLWRVFHPVPALECGGVTAISLIHTAPNYPCSYITTWSLCVGSELFGALLRCHVEVGSGRCWPNDEHQEFVQLRIKRESFTTADTDEQEISRSCVSSFKLNDEASVSGTSTTSASVALLMEKDVTEDCSGVQQQAVVSASSSSDLTNSKSETSKKSADSALIEDDGESSDFEVIPIPSCFDLTRPFKALETETSADNTADSSVDTIAEHKEAIKTNEEESVAGTSTASSNDCGELVEAPPMPTLSDLSVSSSSISILDYSAPQSHMVSTTTSATQEDKVTSSTAAAAAVAASSSSSEQPSTSSTLTADSVINKLVKTKKVGIKERPIPVPRSVLDADKPFQLQQQHEENAQPSTSSPVRKLSKKVNTSRPTNGKEVKSSAKSSSSAAEAREEGSRPTPPATPSKVKAKTPTVNRHAAKLNQLKEMGFSDDQLNKHLLDQFNGDITSVVHALVTHLTGDLNEGEDGLTAPGQLGSRSDNSFMV